MKYIDADRLREELQKPKTELKVGNYYLDNSEQAVGYENALIDFELLIDSLQQEQSEVDLKKEVEKFCFEYDSRKEAWFGMTPSDNKMLSTPTWGNFAANIARHFYELGRKTRKEG